jgi:hypothetical protein
MGQQRNAKLIRRKIRQELQPLYQAVGSMAQALHQHLQETKEDKAQVGQEDIPKTAT